MKKILPNGNELYKCGKETFIFDPANLTLTSSYDETPLERIDGELSLADAPYGLIAKHGIRDAAMIILAVLDKIVC